jgi:DNA-binding HxlR family transcriptional regulator
MIGGKWKFLILFHLAPGAVRFGELRRLTVGISEKMLILALKEMIADGLVARRDFHELPPRVEYSLTGFGRSLAAAVAPLCRWGAAYAKRTGQLRQAPPPPARRSAGRKAA